MTTPRDERGQALVFTVLVLTVMLGMFALVLDVGSWFRAQRDVQSTADAAALAAAQELPESTGRASALAAEYVSKNGGGSAEISFITSISGPDTVRVRIQRPAPGFFARIFGVDSVTVRAKASARSSAIDQARYAAPIAVDVHHPLLRCLPSPCFGQPTTLDLQKVGPGAFRLLNLDGSRGGTGPGTLAEWIAQGFDGMMPLGNYFSDPGAKFNSSQVKSSMNFILGKELLFPLYDTVSGNGSNLTYHVIGWVGFTVSSFSGNGSKGTVTGSFQRVIWDAIGSESPTQSAYGAHTISLVE